jgi:hypothetical protein
VRPVFSIYLLISLLFISTLTYAGPLDEAARIVEELNMERLQAQQNRPGVTIEAFSSDGCSGGLSESWKTLARVWPEMARSIGETPPWEQCCVAHDRDYWRGESIGGFEKRLQSDLRLRQCVSGIDNGADIAARLGVAEKEVVEIINLTAEMMFIAVRVGGGPCTGLVWRWGHGWPRCGSGDEPADNAPNMVQVRITIADSDGPYTESNPL